MMPSPATLAALAAVPIGAIGLMQIRARLLLSSAKHRSLHGHAKLSKLLAAIVPYYSYDDEAFFVSDGAPPEIAARRRSGFNRLAVALNRRAPVTQQHTTALEPHLSDLQFVNTYRVPFQYRRYVLERLRPSVVLESSDGVFVRDLDGNRAYDLTGSYGLNVFGYDFYKECIDAGADQVRALGPVLGAYHPIVRDNVARLKAISGLDEVSFHMSGTEAVMQAVGLARFHTGRTHAVRFCGAYHGWWDGVQPGAGNPRRVDDVYTLKEMDERSLRVLRTRRDIACVLVNPVQALHPNRSAPGDGTLIDSSRRAHFDRDEYSQWLRQLREVCTARAIPLIFDEVFVGFRIAHRGAQEYFGVSADFVTYGKTVGGGLPVGVLCGRHELMKRFRDDRPSSICFARGTFNSHPYVMGAMNEFLGRVAAPEIQASYAALDAVWNERADRLNALLTADGLPIRVANLTSIWTFFYTTPSRYNWMFQYYLRAEGLALSWIGTGRLIFSHSYTDADFAEVAQRIAAAARAMRDDGWFWAAAGLTDRSIRRQVLREMLRARLPRLPWSARRSDRRARLAGDKAASGDRSSRRGTDPSVSW